MRTREQARRINAARYARQRAMLAERRAVPCADCGLYEPAIMDFDHVPERGPKLFNISVGVRGLATLEAELAKCDVVCPNCHRRRTIRRQEEAPE